MISIHCLTLCTMYSLLKTEPNIQLHVLTCQPHCLLLSPRQSPGHSGPPHTQVHLAARHTPGSGSQDVTRWGPGRVTCDVSSPVSAPCQDSAPAHCVISTAVSPFLILTILPERLWGKPGRVGRPVIRDSHNNNGEQRRGNNLNEQSDNRTDNVRVSDSNISKRMWEVDMSRDKLKCWRLSLPWIVTT